MNTKGGQLQTKESFLFGRFETMIKPAFGSGVVSSFFLFSDALGFQTNWKEIDFEFLGRHTNTLDTNLIRTFGGITDKNINVQHHTLGMRASDRFWKLCIEWTPTYVIWKINDIVIRTIQSSLDKPQKLMMNIWVGGAGWAGEFHKGLLPQIATYEYVRISKFINGEFQLLWQDSFDKIDTSRWYIAAHSIGETSFTDANVGIENSRLVLKLNA